MPVYRALPEKMLRRMRVQAGKLVPIASSQYGPLVTGQQVTEGIRDSWQ